MVRKNRIVLATLIFIAICSFFLIVNSNRINYQQEVASIAQYVVKKSDSLSGLVTYYYDTYQDSIIATILGLFSMMQNNISENGLTANNMPDQFLAAQKESEHLTGVADDEWVIVDFREDDVASSGLDQQLIDELLNLAQQQLKQKQLTTPAEDNAWDTYHQILDIVPEHKQATAGIKKIKAIYMRWAKFEIVKGDLKHAELLYRKILEISPNDSEVQETLAWFDDVNKASGKK